MYTCPAVNEVNGEVYIQGERLGTNWEYDDGTQFTFSNWNTGQGWGPGEPVAIIRKSQGYRWHDSNPQNPFGSLC